MRKMLWAFVLNQGHLSSILPRLALGLSYFSLGQCVLNFKLHNFLQAEFVLKIFQYSIYIVKCTRKSIIRTNISHIIFNSLILISDTPSTWKHIISMNMKIWHTFRIVKMRRVVATVLIVKINKLMYVQYY